MVRTDLVRIACSGSATLPASFISSRSADSWIGVSGFLISCASRRATSPQACARCAETISEMSSNTSSRAALPGASAGISAPRATMVMALLRRPGLRRIELERLLPVVQSVLLALVHVFVELLLHRAAESFEARDAGQRRAFVRRQRHAQDAGRARIGRQDVALVVQHDDTGREVVQDGLQVGARGDRPAPCSCPRPRARRRAAASSRRRNASGRRVRPCPATRAWDSGRPPPPRARPRPAPAAAARAGCPG